MTGVIMRALARKTENMPHEKKRAAYGSAAAVTGILCNIILCVLKGAAGIIFNSVAILADAVNNLSDAGNSVIALIGFFLAEKPADEDHPYGHARVEYISCLAVSFVILWLGVSLFKTSVLKIFDPEPIDKSAVSIMVLVISILVKIWMGIFYKKMGGAINSSVILANSKDSFNDVISTGAVLLTTVIAIFTDVNLDAWAGCAVALFIFWSGFGIMKETMNNLLGTMPSPEVVDTIIDKLYSYEGVLGIHDLVVHSYGPEKYFATVHVEVPCDVNILTSHDMIDNIERDFLTDTGINLVIHLDPVVTNDEEVIKTRNMVHDIVKAVDKSYSIHDFRMVKGDTHANLIFDIAAPAGDKRTENEIRDIVTGEIKKKNENYYCIITVDRNYTMDEKGTGR